MQKPENEETVRWHLQCIPTELDTEVRYRQLENRRKYICQQVVADLTAYYELLKQESGIIKDK
jgi:hypothetical protein